MTKTTTAEHRPPGGEQGPSGVPVWLVAFPEPRAVPMPPFGEPIGRAYFTEHGHVDTEISTRHFQLTWRGSTAYIEDVQSRNGTWLRGHRLPPRDPVRLDDGAVVRLGKSLFVYRAAFLGTLEPDRPVDGLVGPWGLRSVRESLQRLRGLRTAAVLIQGETGTGKELVARAAAAALGRAKPYAAVNLVALSPSTMEGHLFGWVRGAFTGADKTDPGLIRTHAGGALFLDEIGELPTAIQAKLLRVLENREVLSVGAHQPVEVDVAFIAATNRDLPEMVKTGAFRADLLARFPVRVTLPPLRERPEDLYSLLRVRWAHQLGRLPSSAETVEVEAVERLLLHTWPGNVRDLDALVLGVMGERFELRLAAVRSALGPGALDQAHPEPPSRQALAAAMAQHGYNQSQAARALGVDRGVVVRMLDKYPELRGSPSKKG